jgi:sigma-E factor negative regulatory protein RseB
LTQLDGEMGEIVRQGNQVMCIFPDNRVVQLEKSTYSNKIVQSFSTFMPDQQNYHLQNLGDCRQVNRPCIKLAIKAVDQHRYSYFLWLDKQTGLLLRSDLKNNEGLDLERFQYTNISFPEQISDKALEPMNAGPLVEHVIIPVAQKDLTWPSEIKWKSDWVPPGFMPIGGNEQVGGNVMIFSDAQTLTFNSHQYSVTVIGEIPAMTAMLVAESVKPNM